MHGAGDKRAVIGSYGATSRQQLAVRRSTKPLPFAQVQREGNPLINELIIGTGFKDTFSISDPANDSQFASFVLNPLLAQLFQSSAFPCHLRLVMTCFCWCNTSLPSAPAAVRTTWVRSPTCSA